MTIDQRMFILAEKALTSVVDRIKDDQWSMAIPTEIAHTGGTLRDCVNYHAYDSAWVPDVLAGKTIAEVGSTFDGDLLGADPKKSWHTISDLAISAVEKYPVTELDKPVHLSYGDFPAREYLWHITSFRGFRFVDLARLLGLDDTMPEGLAEGMWELLSPHAEEWRAMGIYGPAVEVPESASVQAKLLGMSGRKA
jgi:hypothetical protein